MRIANQRRRAGSYGEEPYEAAADAGGLDPARVAALEAAEEMVLSIASDGYGKRTSAYEYRITSRGGKGIDNMDLSRGPDAETATVVAAFRVRPTDQIMLVTNAGQVIRIPVEGISIYRRTTRGVRVFTVTEETRVISVTRLREADGDGSQGPEGENGDGPQVEGEADPSGSGAAAPDEAAAPDDAPDRTRPPLTPDGGTP
jgi:DNA gyrase subunit A